MEGSSNPGEVGVTTTFATGYMRHVLGFIGITDVQVVSANQQMVDADKARAGAEAQVDALAA